MAWSVFNLAYLEGAYEALQPYAHLEKPTAAAVGEGLYYTDVPEIYLSSALDAGLEVDDGLLIEVLSSFGPLIFVLMRLRLVDAWTGPFKQPNIDLLLNLASELLDSGRTKRAIEEKLRAEGMLESSGVQENAQTATSDTPAEGKTAESRDSDAKEKLGFFELLRRYNMRRKERQEAARQAKEDDDEEYNYIVEQDAFRRDSGFFAGFAATDEDDDDLFDGRYSFYGGAQPEPSSEPEFIDYRNAWGDNNEHNWEADGDMEWDLD